MVILSLLDGTILLKRIAFSFDPDYIYITARPSNCTLPLKSPVLTVKKFKQNPGDFEWIVDILAFPHIEDNRSSSKIWPHLKRCRGSIRQPFFSRMNIAKGAPI